MKHVMEQLAAGKKETWVEKRKKRRKKDQCTKLKTTSEHTWATRVELRGNIFVNVKIERKDSIGSYYGKYNGKEK